MITSVHEWSAQGNCLGRPTAEHFDLYEASVDTKDLTLARKIDSRCATCVVQAKCLAFAVTHKEWGQWGGVYFEDGKISKKYNEHKNNDDWFSIWSNLTMDM